MKNYKVYFNLHYMYLGPSFLDIFQVLNAIIKWLIGNHSESVLLYLAFLKQKKGH